MKEEIKNNTSEYTNSMQDMWNEYVQYINSVKKICEDTPIKVEKGKNGNSLAIQIPEAKYKLCDIYEETVAWGTWSAKVAEAILNVPLQTVGILCRALGESVAYASEIIEKGAKYATEWLAEKLSNLTTNNKWVKKIIKKLKLITLFVKKSLLQGKLYMLKLLKKILVFASNNKVTNALSTAYSAVISFIQTNSKIIDIVIQVIENLLNSLIGLSLDGGLMGFFITPKSVLAGIAMPDPNLTMTPANGNKDIYSNIADAIINPIEEGFRQASIVATSGKNSAMVAEISKNTALLIVDDIIDIPDSTVSLEESFNLSALKAAIVGVLTVLFTPEALPKYERLHPGNLGFMAWLLTAFEPTMKKCFGLPGYP